MRMILAPRKRGVLLVLKTPTIKVCLLFSLNFSMVKWGIYI